MDIKVGDGLVYSGLIRDHVVLLAPDDCDLPTQFLDLMRQQHNIPTDQKSAFCNLVTKGVLVEGVIIVVPEQSGHGELVAKMLTEGVGTAQNFNCCCRVLGLLVVH